MFYFLRDAPACDRPPPSTDRRNTWTHDGEVWNDIKY